MSVLRAWTSMISTGQLLSIFIILLVKDSFSTSKFLNNTNQNCYSVLPNGRLGNLMFEYATTIGICVKNGYPVNECAVMDVPDSCHKKWCQIQTPSKKFIQTFSIPTKKCAFKKEIFNERFFEYDKEVLNQPSGTILSGYFQSYKYFDFAYQEIQKAFKFPKQIDIKAKNYLHNMKLLLTKSYKNDHEIVCMAVRRGDKTSTNAADMYDKWALSLNYYKEVLLQSHKKLKRIAVIVFSGGGFTKQEQINDTIWLHDHLINPMQNATITLIDGNPGELTN